MLLRSASLVCRAAARAAVPRVCGRMTAHPTLSFAVQARTKAGIRFTKEHEWVKVNGNVATVGITDYAQDALGDVVFVEILDKDSEIAKGETCGAVESVKAVSEIYSPITGVILEGNVALESEPGKINEDPLGDGWIVKIEIANPAELDELLDADAYDAFCKSEAH